MYLFTTVSSFKTSKGVGYTGSVIGSNLVISSIRVKGKPMQHCVKFEFSPGRVRAPYIPYIYSIRVQVQVAAALILLLFSSRLVSSPFFPSYAALLFNDTTHTLIDCTLLWNALGSNTDISSLVDCTLSCTVHSHHYLLASGTW